MSIRKVPLVQGEYYHVYNRGNDKRKIFLDEEDMDRFVKLLYLCNSTKRVNFRDDIVNRRIDTWDYDREETIVSIGAWVLMPNHFHIYITLPRGKASGKEPATSEMNGVTAFMLKLCTSYTMYFNKKYNRTGALFEGKFKSVHIPEEIQAKYLFSYIHLNPIKLIQSDWKEVGIKNTTSTLEHLKKYRWSSYSDHKKSKRKELAILSMDDFPKYFPKIVNFDKEIMGWINQYRAHK